MSPVAMRQRWSAATRAVPTRADTTCSHWLARTARHYDISVLELCERNRSHLFARRRWVAMWLLRRDGFSMAQIAAQLELANHSTVLHGLQQIDAHPDLVAVAKEIQRRYAREQRAWRA